MSAVHLCGFLRGMEKVQEGRAMRSEEAIDVPDASRRSSSMKEEVFSVTATERVESLYSGSRCVSTLKSWK